MGGGLLISIKYFSSSSFFKKKKKKKYFLLFILWKSENIFFFFPPEKRKKIFLPSSGSSIQLQLSWLGWDCCNFNFYPPTPPPTPRESTELSSAQLNPTPTQLVGLIGSRISLKPAWAKLGTAESQLVLCFFVVIWFSTSVMWVYLIFTKLYINQSKSSHFFFVKNCIVLYCIMINMWKQAVRTYKIKQLQLQNLLHSTSLLLTI